MYNYNQFMFPFHGYVNFSPWNIVLIIIIGVILLITTAFSLAAYIIESIGYQKILKHRGYTKSWLIWIPFVRIYVKTALADDILIKKGKMYRLSVGSAIIIIFNIFCVASMITSYIFGFYAVLIFLEIALSLTSLALMVLKFISLYQFYDDYIEDSNILFFVLTIFFPLVEPIVAIVCRNKIPKTLRQ